MVTRQNTNSPKIIVHIVMLHQTMMSYDIECLFRTSNKQMLIVLPNSGTTSGE